MLHWQRVVTSLVSTGNTTCIWRQKKHIFTSHGALLITTLHTPSFEVCSRKCHVKEASFVCLTMKKKTVNDSTTNVVSFVNNIMTMKLGSYLAFGPWQVCLIFYVETRLWHTLICAVLCGQGIKLVHRFVATQSHVLLSEAWLNVFCVCIVAAWHQPRAINVAVVKWHDNDVESMCSFADFLHSSAHSQTTRKKILWPMLCFKW